jgi:hypothetical protein
MWSLAELKWPLGLGERVVLRRAVAVAAPRLPPRETAMVVRGVAVLGLANHRGSSTRAALSEAIERSIAGPARKGVPFVEFEPDC